MRRTLLLLAALLPAVLLPAACSHPSDGSGAPDMTPTRAGTSAAPPATSSSPVPTTSSSPAPGTVPPPWLGTRPLPSGPDGTGQVRATPPELRDRRFTLPDRLPPLPGRGFASRVVSPPPADVIARSTWQPGCPVTVDDLAWVRLTFRGFEGGRHTGELLVDRASAGDLVQVFHDLWDARFPLEEMHVTTLAERDAAPTGDGNDTGAFVCRPVTGGTSYSQHAYGLAIDVNPFQNPYSKGEVVIPELASAYLDRDDLRPGMITPDGPVVRAFASIGWGWGGDFTTLRDLQHFSADGR